MGGKKLIFLVECVKKILERSMGDVTFYKFHGDSRRCFFKFFCVNFKVFTCSPETFFKYTVCLGKISTNNFVIKFDLFLIFFRIALWHRKICIFGIRSSVSSANRDSAAVSIPLDIPVLKGFLGNW